MAAKIGDLIVELKANTAAFSADMGKASAAMNSATAQMRLGIGAVSNAFSLATRAAGVFGVSLGVGALIGFGKRALDAAGGLGELAEQLGISTDSLQTYQFAAAQSGVTTEELQTSIARFTKTIGDARDGSDTAVRAVRALGGGFEQLVASGASIDDLLLAFSDRIAQTGDRSVAAARGTDLMGKGFQRVLTIFGSGQTTIQGFANALDEVGLRLDADAIRKADGASDAIARMNFQVNALAQTLVSRLAPAIESAARGWNAILSGPSLSEQIVRENKRLLDLRKELASFGDNPRSAGEKGEVETLKREIDAQEKRVNDLIAKAREQAAKIPNPPVQEGPAAAAAPAGTGSALVGNRERQLMAGLETQRDSIDKVGAALLRVRLEREVDEKGQRVWNTTQINAAVAVQEQTDALMAASRAAEMYHQAAIASSAADDEARIAARERSDAILGERAKIELSLQREYDDTQALTRALAESQRAYEVEAEFIRIRNQYRAAGIPLYGEEIEAARKLAARNVEANRTMERTGAEAQELANFTDRAFDRIGGSITDATTRGKDGFIDMGSIGRGVLVELQQEAIKLSLINPFKNWAFGQNNPTGGTGSMWGDLFGSIFGNSGGPNALVGGAGASSDAAFEMMNAGAGAFADGTPNAPPGWAVVGEAGPELVKFRGGERVFSNAESQRLGGGQTINVYPDLRGASVEAVNALMREVRRLNASIEPRVVATLLGETGRGGRMREVMG
jgi:hypothetical protein